MLERGLIMLLLSMCFMHIVDDYYLQGVLASMKQKQWWADHCPDDKNKYDYIIALIMHAFSWTFMIMLPYLIYIHGNIYSPFGTIFLLNVVTHALVDHMKANLKWINLIEDQLIHMVQILVTISILLR